MVLYSEEKHFYLVNKEDVYVSSVNRSSDIRTFVVADNKKISIKRGIER